MCPPYPKQSVALKIIVDREKEIQAFKSKEYYEIFLPFIKNGTLYKAQYKGLIKEEKNTPTIKDKELCDKIVEGIRGTRGIFKRAEITPNTRYKRVENM